MADASGLLTDNPWIATIVAETDLKDDQSAIGNYTLINQDTRNRINNYDGVFTDTLENVLANLEEFDDSYELIQGYVTAINTNLTNLSKVYNNDTTAPATDPTTAAEFAKYATADNVKTWTEAVRDNYNDLVAELARYEDLYSAITQTAMNELNLTGLDIGNTNPVTTFIAGDFAALDLTDLETDSTTYQEAWKDCNEQFKPNGILAQADATWTADVAAYNKAVGDAKTKYDRIISQGYLEDDNYTAQPSNPNFNAGKYLPDGATAATTLTLSNNGKKLVPYNAVTDVKKEGYSANFTADNADPTITATSDNWKVYTTDEDYSSKPLNDSKAYVTSAGTKVIEKQDVYTEATFGQLSPRPDDNTDDYYALKLGVLDLDEDGNITGATTGTLADKLKAAETALTTAGDNYEKAQQAKTDAADDVAAATTKKNTAQAAANALKEEEGHEGEKDTSKIKLYIVLDDNAVDTATPANGNWTMDNEPSTAVDFYLNNILEAGETSAKLIDYVKMDDAVTSLDYKNLTFDLNVALDSAQVTYDADQRYYTPTAVNENPTFELVAAVGDDNSTVAWTEAPAAQQYTYKVRGEEVTPTALPEGTKIDDTTYYYQIKTVNGTFWTTSDKLEDGTQFVKVDTTTDPGHPTLVTGEGTNTVTMSATPKEATP